jgi:hypothetical protein
LLKIAILQDSEFVTFVIVISSSNVGSTIIVANDGVSIPFLLQQVVGFKVIVIVKLIIAVLLVLTFVIQLVILLIFLLVFKTFFFIKTALQ